MLYGNLGPFMLLKRRRGRAWAIAYGLKYFSCEASFVQNYLKKLEENLYFGHWQRIILLKWFNLGIMFVLILLLFVDMVFSWCLTRKQL